MVRKIISAVIVVVLISSCASKKVGSLPQYHPQNIPNLQVTNELIVAVESWHQKDKVIKYFGTNLISNNVFPIFIKIRNNNSLVSYLLLKDNCFVSDEKDINKLEKLIGEGKSSKGGETIVSVGWGMVGLVGAVGIPLMLAGASQAASASVINHNIRVNELQTVTIRSGNSCQGFLYFQLPKENRPKNVYLYLQFRELNNNTKVNFRFDVLLPQL